MPPGNRMILVDEIMALKKLNKYDEGDFNNEIVEILINALIDIQSKINELEMQVNKLIDKED